MEKLKITIKYLPSLGSYLDENAIWWINNSDGTITIEFKDAKEAFETGVGYEKFMHSIETE